MHETADGEMVSVVVPAYNAAAYLRETLVSALA
jgi:glycosyltransferase involved in cell wall biosynthesis